MTDSLMDRIEHLQETSLFVEDLTCKHCIRNILDDLRSMEGIVAARVSAPPTIDTPPDEQVCGVTTVKFNPNFIDPDRIRQTIEHHGFRVIRLQQGSPPGGI